MNPDQWWKEPPGKRLADKLTCDIEVAVLAGSFRQDHRMGASPYKGLVDLFAAPSEPSNADS